MRCRALTETTGERCRRHAVNGMDTCSIHTPKAWNPRLDHAVTISRSEIEALMGGSDHLLLDWLTVALYRRIRITDRSNLALLAKMERTLPLEDMAMRLAVLRRILALCDEAAELLQALDDDDDADRLQRLDMSRRPAPPDLPPS